MLDKVKSAHPGQKIGVCFQDEARFGRQGTITRVWAKTGSRCSYSMLHLPHQHYLIKKQVSFGGD